MSAAASDERRVALEHTLNTRDLGGYTTTDGRQLKWGMLYRSDSLAELSPGDVSALASLNLATVTDFRSDGERASAPDRLPAQVPPISYQVLNVNNPALDVSGLGRKVYAGELGDADLRKLLDRSAYVTDAHLRRAWGDWLRSLAEPGALPQLFHCTAGKDRTGFAAALVMLALGVERQQVMADFVLSNRYLDARIRQGVASIQAHSDNALDPALLAQVLGVSAGSLDGAIAAMESNYGSVHGYLEDGLGVDAATLERLQALLLEPATR